MYGKLTSRFRCEVCARTAFVIKCICLMGPGHLAIAGTKETNNRSDSKLSLMFFGTLCGITNGKMVLTQNSIINFELIIFNIHKHKHWLYNVWKAEVKNMFKVEELVSLYILLITLWLCSTVIAEWEDFSVQLPVGFIVDRNMNIFHWLWNVFWIEKQINKAICLSRKNGSVVSVYCINSYSTRKEDIGTDFPFFDRFLDDICESMDLITSLDFFECRLRLFSFNLFIKQRFT